MAVVNLENKKLTLTTNPVEKQAMYHFEISLGLHDIDIFLVQGGLHRVEGNVVKMYHVFNNEEYPLDNIALNEVDKIVLYTNSTSEPVSKCRAYIVGVNEFAARGKLKYLLENELKQLAANLLRKLEVVRQYSCIA